MQRSALCTSRRELSNEYLLAKFGFDTTENEPCEVLKFELSEMLNLNFEIPKLLFATQTGEQWLPASAAPVNDMRFEPSPLKLQILGVPVPGEGGLKKSPTCFRLAF